MLLVANGYCAEIGDDGLWSRPPENALNKHESLDPELILPPENHSRLQKIQTAAGYTATIRI